MNILPYCRNIYYYETDRMDVVSHTNYIRWMEEARVDFMKQMGIPYHEIEKSGLMLPVLEVECKYKKSLTFGDSFCIYSEITYYNGFKLNISYKIYNKETNELCATAKSSHCFTDKNMKPIRITQKAPELHEAFINAMNVQFSE